MPVINSKIPPIKLPRFQHVIDDRLIRGRSVTCPYRLYKMKQQGINQVIDLRQTSYIKRLVEKFFCKLLGIKFLNHKCDYRQGKLQPHEFFEKLNDTILSNNGRTYLHCSYGEHRSGVAVAVYEKFHTNKSDEEIITNLQKLNYKESSIKNEKMAQRAKNYNDVVAAMMERYFQN